MGRHIIAMIYLSLSVTACGGGSSPAPPPPPSPPYSIGGTVSGLDAGQSVVLHYNGGPQYGGEDLTVSANEPFDFATKVASGGSYFVYATPPWGKACTVKGSSGKAFSNVTSVAVVCVSNLLGEFAYLASSTANTISAYSVDGKTGAITSVGPPVAAGKSPSAIASTSDRKFVYVSNSGSNDISVIAVDPISGALTTSPGSPVVAGTNPRALVLYSGVYKTPGYGHPSNVPPRSVNYLYAANAGSNDLSAYAVDTSTGALTPLSPASYATGTGPSAIAIGHSMTTNPSPSFLYSANIGGSGDISAFYIETRTGGLTPIAGSPIVSGSSVSSLAVGTSNPPGEGFLYAADASGSAAAIYGFSADPTGVLTALPGFPMPLGDCTYIVADQSGSYLYAAVGTNIIGYVIDRDSGALSPLAGFPIAFGGNVQSMSIDPTDQLLYVANGSAGTVTGFELNIATGGLTPVPGSPFDVGQSADFIATF